jgi:hypothetical protein
LGERRFALGQADDFAVGALIFFTERFHRFFRFVFRAFAFCNRRFQLFNIFLFLGDLINTQLTHR